MTQLRMDNIPRFISYQHLSTPESVKSTWLNGTEPTPKYGGTAEEGVGR